MILGLVELIDVKVINVALYGREAVRHKLKNGLKTQKMHFLPPKSPRLLGLSLGLNQLFRSNRHHKMCITETCCNKRYTIES